MTERQTPPESDDKITAAEAAAVLGVSIRTLDRYQRAGELIPCPIPRRPRYFNRAAVEQFAQTGSMANVPAGSVVTL